MKRVSVKLPEDMVEELDERADNQDVTRSDVIRNTLDDGLDTGDDPRIQEYEERIQELEDEVEWLKGRVKAKENEFETLVAQREENTELKEYVSEQQRRKELGWFRSRWNDLTGWD